jgi:phosphoribosylformylglycinamidine synthase
VPGLPAEAPALYRALHAAMGAGLVRACHDLSEGGLAVAAAEMCIGGRLGMALALPPGDLVRMLFGERNGALLAAVRPGAVDAFEAGLVGLSAARLGVVVDDGRLVVGQAGRVLIDLPVETLVAAWNPPTL